MTLDGSTLLLVEDDILILQDLAMTLSRAGATVITAISVETGLAAAKGAINAAILDIVLRDEDVIPLARELDAKGVPIVFHSAVSDRADVVSEFTQAVRLSKPVNETTLINTVMKVLKRA